MTKAEVITKISQRTGLERQDVAASVETFFKVVKSAMEQGDNLYFRGFGSFVVKKRARKVARIISRNETIVIPEHYVPSFKPAKTFTVKVKEAKDTGTKKKTTRK